MDEESHD
jgi:hypothetical protein